MNERQLLRECRQLLEDMHTQDYNKTVVESVKLHEKIGKFLAEKQAEVLYMNRERFTPKAIAAKLAVVRDARTLQTACEHEYVWNGDGTAQCDQCGKAITVEF